MKPFDETMRYWIDGADAREFAKSKIEVWASVRNVCGYFVSNFGRVVRMRAGVPWLLNGTLTAGGRTTVSLNISGRSQTNLVYRVEVCAFDGPPTPGRADVRHLDGDETNNRLDNLCWGSRSENMLDVVQHRKLGALRTPTAGARTWYPGRTLDDAAVLTGLKLLDEHRVTIVDLAAMWGCTSAQAEGITSGKTRSDLERPAVPDQRKGERHYSSKATDAEVIEALALYVQHHWSSVQFSEHLGIPQISGHAILKGNGRAYIPRPAGFQYPWPNARSLNRLSGEKHGCAKLTDDRVAEVLYRVASGALTGMADIAEAFGVSKGVAYGILRGDKWAHVPRPPGLAEAVAGMQRRILSPEVREAILADLLGGVHRNEVKAKYGLANHTIAAYVTQANKIKDRSEASESSASRT